ncbi:MAG: type II toxin-antitoxin system TacA family antitoxin [Solirubrobacteraceae bacterium]
MSATKEERLQIRVEPADKVLLERAAAASHLNMSAFVIQAAASRAEEVLAERSSIRLSAHASAAFTEALERPAEVNDRLANALHRRRMFNWLD